MAAVARPPADPLSPASGDLLDPESSLEDAASLFASPSRADSLYADAASSLGGPSARVSVDGGELLADVDGGGPAAWRALLDLRRQLDEVAAALRVARGAADEAPAEAAAAVAAECLALRAEAEGRAAAARLAATACARAAAAAEWAAERAKLEACAEVAARVGEAMSLGRESRRREAEGAGAWRERALSSAVAVGCSAVGAAAAVLLIRSMTTHHR
jgi:hypothetical protein